MIRYVLGRLVYGLVVLALVTVFVFVAITFIPSDAVDVMLADTGATEEQAAAMRSELGLDRPVWEQLGSFLGNAVQGDFGRSFYTDEPVVDLFLDRIPITLQLGGLALVIGTVLGLVLGIIAAVRRGTATDGAVRVTAVTFLSVPNFVLGLLILTALGLWFAWSPPFVYRGPTEDFVSWAQHMAIPAIALGTASMAGITRMTRSSLLENLGSQYIRTVRAKGAGERLVLFKHAMRNSVIAVLTLIGVDLATVLGGTVILEQMFSLPGTGQLVYQAVLDRDYPVVIACTIFYAGLFIVTMIIIDLLYAFIDPRIRAAREAGR
ncbi:ABC transporter permease [Geodermatophilus sabuli]|uniref:ABC transporter permease n=1 Tax=Geodermatophilus sabuli TaxID=1564158 RepID=A0A7K3VYH0_9ACTN|nr:ABC transporter permease [Geodermatophilus sabuli]NEK57681.1 ABC transporter permease [Geodermatophilus sabuli]